MPENKKETVKPEVKKLDPKLQQRAERLAKAGPGKTIVGYQSFVKETISELKKTHWPEPEVLKKSTYVVLIFILAVAAWVGLADHICNSATKFIFKH